MCKLNPKIRTLLEDSGAAWSIKPGRRHDLLFVEGRMVLPLPRGSRVNQNGRCAVLNALATVRRRLREVGHAV
jgi:hypothetical protein